MGAARGRGGRNNGRPRAWHIRRRRHGAVEGAAAGGAFGAAAGHAIEETIRALTQSMELAQRGRGNRRHPDLSGKRDDEIADGARDRSLPGPERRRYQEEEKARGERNKSKREERCK